MSTAIDDAVTDDAFLGGRVRLVQPAAGFRAGLDAVLLAAATPVKEGCGERVLDVGAGIGTVSCCLMARISDVRCVLIEREPKMAALAERNIARNGMSGRAMVVAADIADDLSGYAVTAGTFEHVIANPPFHAEHEGSLPADPARSGANAMPDGSIDGWARFLTRMAAPRGTLTLIHKAAALPKLLAAFDRRFGAIGVLPVIPRPGAAASRVIISGVKGSRAPFTLHGPLYLHEASGHAFTSKMQSILRDGAGLQWNV